MNSISSEGFVGPSADGTSTPRRCKTMDRFTQAGKKKNTAFPELEETPGKISGRLWEWKDKPSLLREVRGQGGAVGGTERLIQTALESKPLRSRSMCPLDFHVTEGKRADGSAPRTRENSSRSKVTGPAAESSRISPASLVEGSSHPETGAR